MEFFYDKEVFKTKLIEEKNNIGQLIKSYTIDISFMADVQPILEESKSTVWGENIKGKYEMYCNEEFKIDDVIVYIGKSYIIENKIHWDDYFIYSLLERDVKVYDIRE